jgi:hypothetical protein
LWSQDLVISAQVFWPWFPFPPRPSGPGTIPPLLRAWIPRGSSPARRIARLAGRAPGHSSCSSGSSASARRRLRCRDMPQKSVPAAATERYRCGTWDSGRTALRQTGTRPAHRAPRLRLRCPVSGTGSPVMVSGQRTHRRGVGLRVRGPRHVADRDPASGAVNCRQCQPAKLAIGITAGLLRFCVAAGARVRVPTLGRPFAPLCSGDLVSKPDHSRTPVRTDPESYFW